MAEASDLNFSKGVPPKPATEEQTAENQQEKDLKASYEAVLQSEKYSDEKHKVFAIHSRDLWQRCSAQGNRSGKKGIRATLKALEIPEKTARKAIKRFFPNFFPKPKPRKKKPDPPKPEPGTRAENFVPGGNEVGSPHMDVPKDFAGLLAWSAGTVRPLLQQVCQPLDEKQKAAGLKTWFAAIAACVLPEELSYVTVGRKAGPKK